MKVGPTLALPFNIQDILWVYCPHVYDILIFIKWAYLFEKK
jgi:hypothetical protein